MYVKNILYQVVCDWRKKWHVKMEEKENLFSARMVKKNAVENYEDISLDDVVTYHQKYIIRIADEIMVVSINIKLTTI